MLTSGFANATITKYAVGLIIASSIAVSVTDVKYLFYIQVVPHLWHFWQWWRMLIWPLCYTNSTEVLLACIVMYSLRVVERIWGPRKFASFILSTLPYTTLIPPIVVSLILRPLSLNTYNYLPAGPTAIIFAVLSQYHSLIPAVYKYNISTTDAESPWSITFPLSDKSIIYFLALQLSLSQFPYTILPALTGWIIGLAWRAEFLPGHFSSPSWRIPYWIYGGKEPVSEPRRGGTGGTDSAQSRGRESESYEGLRRRLDDQSRATIEASRGQSSRTAGPEESGRAFAESFLGRFRGST